jgi:hypothetical protein
MNSNHQDNLSSVSRKRKQQHVFSEESSFSEKSQTANSEFIVETPRKKPNIEYSEWKTRIKKREDPLLQRITLTQV